MTTSSHPTTTAITDSAPSYLIRPARRGDLTAVLALVRAAGLPDDGISDQFGEQYAVAECCGAIIGVEGIEVHGGDGLLRSAAVAAAWRGKGIGEALTRDRLGWARGRGLQSVYLLTTTAGSYFPRYGFAPFDRDRASDAIRTSAEFRGVCPSSAECLRLALRDVEPEAKSQSGADCCGPTCCTTEESVRTLSLSKSAARLGVPDDATALRDTVKAKYGAAAERASAGEAAGCGTSCCGGSADEAIWNPITSDLYEEGETAGLPAEALLASLGCGNPAALASLSAGEVVLDLGSGGGIDVLLSAKRVGPTGKAYGLDMTEEMLALARENQRRAGAENVEFLRGEIEHIPLPDASVDVIISNCVINLSADKGQVLREAYRVLRPGGRFAVSDVVVRGKIPDVMRRNVELWIGCVAGALEEDEYRALLASAGFTAIDVEPTRIYRAEDARVFLEEAKIPVDEFIDAVDGRLMSAFVRAQKPA